jgi:hypothetical protein
VSGAEAPDPAAPTLDHLVVMADTLAEGAAWCQATLGAPPVEGGRHALFGTHNLLLHLGSPAFPRRYLEIIAIDPDAEPAPGPQGRPRARWFDMDDPALRQRVRRRGPQLIHWVARVPDIDAAVTALATRGIDRGDVLAASRATAHGELRWKISVRPDGQRLFHGLLPSLIEWGAQHPTDELPASGVTLHAASLTHPRAGQLLAACAAVGLSRVSAHTSAEATSRLRFETPLGPVDLAGAT